MNSKYRTYDHSTNIISNSKATSYGPSRSLRPGPNNRSYKKMQSLNVKIFDRPKKNPRVLSRNDRMDLFLEGGNFSQTRRVQTKRLNDRSFYKMMKMKKKSQIFVSLRDQLRTNGWHYANNIVKSQNQHVTKSDYFNFLHSSDGGRRNQVQVEQRICFVKNIQQIKVKVQMEEISMDNISIRKSESCQKKVRNVSKQKQKKINDTNTATSTKNQEHRNQYKSVNQKGSNLKQNTNSQNQLQKIDKIKRPLFYLQAKQISHIKADSFIVTEFPSGRMVFGNYFKKAGEIASLTKIMTFYTVMKIAEKYNRNVKQQLVEIDQQAQYITGTSAQIFVGDVYSIEQLCYGLMLPSGNDAATALAKWGGKLLQENDILYRPESKNTEVKTFIKYMNVMAKQCGMKISKFCNPHGLPHPQASSNAEDLACLVSECLKIELFKTVIKTKQYKCWVQHNGVKHQVIWENTNKLLRRPNFIGGKTGVTVTAGPCLASCYEIKDRIFIIIILRTNKLSRRFKETRYVLGLALTKIDKQLYRQNIKQLYRNDPELDSDNSDDQAQFNYDRNDAKQMAKRNKILTFQM